jgi:hypothetical protein
MLFEIRNLLLDDSIQVLSRGSTNDRSVAEKREPSEEEVDIAIIAAALNSLPSKNKSRLSSFPADSNQWKLSGRVAALQGRQVITDRGPSKWRRS